MKQARSATDNDKNELDTHVHETRPRHDEEQRRFGSYYDNKFPVGDSIDCRANQRNEVSPPSKRNLNEISRKKSMEAATTEDSCSLWSETQLKNYFPKSDCLYDENDKTITDESVVVLADGAVIFARARNDIDAGTENLKPSPIGKRSVLILCILKVREYKNWFIDDCLLRPFWYSSITLTLMFAIIGFVLNVVAHKSPSFLTLPEHRVDGLIPGYDNFQPVEKFGLFFMIICEEDWTDDETLSYGPSYEIIAPEQNDTEKEAAEFSGFCHLERIDNSEMNDLLWEMSRIASSLGLMLGMCAILGLLACFLSRRLNLRAIAGFSISAYLAQNFTFMVFGSDICRDETEGKISCKMSSGAFFGLTSAAAWFLASIMIVYMWYIRNKSPELYDFMNDKAKDGFGEKPSTTELSGVDHRDDEAPNKKLDATLRHASTWTSTDSDESDDIVQVKSLK